MTTIGSHDKDPADTRIYTINWAPFLATSGATITASSWVVPAGLTDVANAFSTTLTQRTVSGGTLNAQYELTNTVTLSNGEIVKAKIQVSVRA